MSDYNHFDELVNFTPSQPGWFAFFHDDENEDEPFWAEPIVGWGVYDLYYPDNEDLNRREVLAMKVEEESGTLTSDFIYAENFLGVMFSTLVEFSSIRCVPSLQKRLWAIVEARAQAETSAEESTKVEGTTAAQHIYTAEDLDYLYTPQDKE